MLEVLIAGGTPKMEFPGNARDPCGSGGKAVHSKDQGLVPTRGCWLSRSLSPPGSTGQEVDG